MTDTLVTLLLALSHVLGGSLGWAIVALSLGIRVALLPLTLRLARRMRRNQEVFRQLQPEIAALKRRFEKEPERLFGEMQRVYRKHGYRPIDAPALLGSLVQWPIFGLLYGAIRKSIASAGSFLWIRSLASPDALLTLLVLTLSGIAAYYGATAPTNVKLWIVGIQLLFVGWIVWKLAAGLSLYWVSSSAIGLVQSLWLRRSRSSKPNVAL